MQNQKFEITNNTSYLKGKKRAVKRGWNNSNKKSVLFNNKNKNTVKSFSYLP